jgi:hypothetical protein
MRIKFFSSFCDSLTCKYHYERVCQVSLLDNYGPDKALYITTEDDYTHAIILNTAMPVLKNIGKANVLGLAFEPPPFLQLTPAFIQYAQTYIGKYFIGSKYVLFANAILPDVFKEHYAYIWHIAPLPFNYVPPKTRLMSIMVSEKKNAPGHQYRHTLVKHILSKGLPIDIYGRGAALYKGMYGSIYKKDPRLMGQFKELEPYLNYSYHICIENFMTPAYFSEKITNALLCSTTPVYWGCTRILDYFPANVLLLSGDVEKDITLLQAICAEPMKYRATIKLDVLKEKLNLLKNVSTMFG